MSKQKLCKVKFKNISGFDNYYLNYEVATKEWFIDTGDEGSLFRTSFTKEELEEAGFGWVFNNPLTEVWELL
ncbi:MAG: hypothetical protein E6523_00070 [Streptococcus sp.]|nr:hypothetical protein [Lachnospiraceae bacterium oral taxon 082]MDU6561258.1 hypothetical protein [Streptococcus sp.]DAZ32996.1 MAG TPA: Protein of unknown function (DUF1642) [Caudoviricetes sp.]